MALKSIPPQSPASSISASKTSSPLNVRSYPNQKPWITGNIHTKLRAKAAAFKERGTNPAMPSDEPSNRQSANKGLRLNTTTPALTLVRCGRA